MGLLDGVKSLRQRLQKLVNLFLRHHIPIGVLEFDAFGNFPLEGLVVGVGGVEGDEGVVGEALNGMNRPVDW